MSHVVKMLFLVFSFISVTSAYASDLTEESVYQIIAKVDNAVNTLDAGAVEEALSNNVEIIMNISMQGQKQTLKPSKQEYLAMLRQAWSQVTSYQYNRSNTVIDIQGNQAFITADIQESMTIQGQNISTVSQEEVTIELIAGRPLVTKIIGYTSL